MSATLNWSYAGSGHNGFNVRWGLISEDLSTKTPISVAPASRSQVITGINSPGDTYHAEVRAKTSSGAESAPAVAQLTVELDPPTDATLVQN